MADIYCRHCGEPWDAYGVSHGDMEQDEAKKFKRGLGCPCCGFEHTTEPSDKRDAEFLYSLVESTDSPDEILDLL